MACDAELICSGPFLLRIESPHTLKAESDITSHTGNVGIDDVQSAQTLAFEGNPHELADLNVIVV
jgi:hypothetical protein